MEKNAAPFLFRYQKYDFTLRFTSDCRLPEFKESMLRGSIGEMLLRSCCIGNRRCAECIYEADCAVSNIYYQKLKLVPQFSHGKESLGCIYECQDHRRVYHEGDTFKFSAVLLGGMCIHFPAFLNALFRLGLSGIMNNGVYFSVDEAVNSTGEQVVGKQDEATLVNFSNAWHDIAAAYIKRRMSVIAPDGIEGLPSKRPCILCRLTFIAPAAIQSRGRLIDEFSAETLSDNIYRRIFLLNCLEGNEVNPYNPFREHVEIKNQRFHAVTRKRYSNTQAEKITLTGIIGEIELAVSPEFLPYLLAGELLHIGKNASMGFGKYEVEQLLY